MITIIVTRVLLFLLPFALYGLYLHLLKSDAETGRPRTPWTMLFIAGFTLVALSFLVLGLFGESQPDGAYVPPQAVDGKVVPGHFGGKTD